MIYSPTGLTCFQVEQLEEALRRDRARIQYQGNDGSEEYVIVEACAFPNTRRLGETLDLPLVWHQPKMSRSVSRGKKTM